MKSLESAAVAITLVLMSLSANAAFVGILPETSGGSDWQAYYDEDQDITWTADANINGLWPWEVQMDWAAGLNIGGVSGWRLPNMDVNGDGVVIDCSTATITDCEDNEMGFLRTGQGITFGNPSPFSNILTVLYWSSTELASDPDNAAWGFEFQTGVQFSSDKDLTRAAWAVRSGDASVVPIPTAFWLFGSALGLLGWVRRKTA